MRTLGCSRVKGLKRVSKGSASIWIVSTVREHAHCGAYHGLQRLIALLLARLALVLCFLSFWRHIENCGVLRKGGGAVVVLDSRKWWVNAEDLQESQHHALTHNPQSRDHDAKPDLRVPRYISIL
jgi:hypothetical protein